MEWGKKAKRTYEHIRKQKFLAIRSRRRRNCGKMEKIGKNKIYIHNFPF